MCGIVGILNLNKEKVHNYDDIVTMMSLQEHRGPDDEGIVAYSFLDKSCYDFKSRKDFMALQESLNCEGVLGFNRLSIRDVSMNGHQPMLSRNKKVILTFNGEIYNCRDLREELKCKGYKFRGASDTEVILNLYLELGFKDMLLRLNGMFAIVIVDREKEKIYIARDRFGIKPLYYAIIDGQLYVASEYKCICMLPHYEGTINEKVLGEYLIYRCVSHDATLFSDIKMVLPGTFIEINNNVKISFEKYFDINTYKRAKVKLGWNKTKYMLSRAIKNSVKRQLVSDVKVGCQLSGGVDSSVVTYYAKKLKRNQELESVSVTFKNPKYSEEQYIDTVKKTLGIECHKSIFGEAEFRQNYEKAIWHLETILVHPNSMGILHLTQRAKEYVTVLLSGEGADEILGGYDQFVNGKLNRLNPLSGKVFSKYVSEYPIIITESSFKKVLSSNLKYQEILNDREKLFNSLSGSLFDKQIKYEMSTYLPELLIRQDKMSMANSIENRVPLLDNEVVDYVMKLPEYMLINLWGRKIEGKYILKRICGDIYGTKHAFRNKMGFSMPIREYMSQLYFQDYFMNVITPGMEKRKIFNYKYVASLLKKIKSATNEEVEIVWRCISFEVWCQLFIDKRKYRAI